LVGNAHLRSLAGLGALVHAESIGVHGCNGLTSLQGLAMRTCGHLLDLAPLSMLSQSVCVVAMP